MKAPWSGQLSAAQTGWLFALLFFGWLAFLFVPAPKPEPEPTPPVVKPPPSRLVALGLPDNPDFEHLPEYFALYADKAEWKDDKTIFAYWNPGSRSYSYYFEAVRVNGSYHFTPRSMVYAGEDENDIYDDGLYWRNDLSKDCPLRFVYTDTESRYDTQRRRAVIFIFPVPVVKPNISTDPIKPPSPELNFLPLDLEPKKK